MNAQQELGTATDFAQHASPSLVQFAQTLALPSDALEELVEREVASNPALERLPVADTPRAGCPRADDFAETLAHEPSDTELLAGAARLLLPAADHALAEAVAGSLTSRGFLPVPVDVLASELGDTTERVERVVAALRDAGLQGRQPAACASVCWLSSMPSAAGAQAMRLHAPSSPTTCPRWRPAGSRSVALRAAREHPRRRRSARPHPNPAAALRRHGTAVRMAPATGGTAARDRLPRHQARGGHDVEVLEASRIAVGVSPLYSAPAFGGGTREAAALGADLHRAHAFLGRLEERWRALRALGESLALHQDAFLRHGQAELRPLTRARIARELGVHESTVSRSVAGKHAALPGGGVVALSAFFTTSCDARDALRDLVACEPRPLPDAALADAMRRRGFPSRAGPSPSTARPSESRPSPCGEPASKASRTLRCGQGRCPRAATSLVQPACTRARPPGEGRFAASPRTTKRSSP